MSTHHIPWDHVKDDYPDVTLDQIFAALKDGGPIRIDSDKRTDHSPSLILTDGINFLHVYGTFDQKKQIICLTRYGSSDEHRIVEFLENTFGFEAIYEGSVEYQRIMETEVEND